MWATWAAGAMPGRKQVPKLRRVPCTQGLTAWLPQGQALRDLPAAGLVRSLQCVGMRENLLQRVSKTCAWGSPLALLWWLGAGLLQLRIFCGSVILHSLSTRSLPLGVKALAPTHCSHTESPRENSCWDGPDLLTRPQLGCQCQKYHLTPRTSNAIGVPVAVIKGDICAETRCFSMCSVFLPMHFRDMSRVW